MMGGVVIWIAMLVGIVICVAMLRRSAMLGGVVIRGGAIAMLGRVVIWIAISTVARLVGVGCLEVLVRRAVHPFSLRLCFLREGGAPLVQLAAVAARPALCWWALPARK